LAPSTWPDALLAAATENAAAPLADDFRKSRRFTADDDGFIAFLS
jgi:hypothetical protein